MKKLRIIWWTIAILIIIFCWVILPNICSYFYNIDEEEELHKTSRIMRNEIIRQLKEKEGKTIQDYYIENHFREISNEKDF